ncbi:cell envelope-related function transcriptional attenuator common domain protein [Pseudarthrobacter siccitolerans]|uniref:Cell envelope-related function transcriptional attenuator common domain protein n=1 Tax=Pseudarthrobacter siccitolerans TaxID=861266 RepID=A0A024GYU3_9MICC|nr:LCP family protein [Pseudarthrobacter siccitolerans]CCQ44923.1 cell envelope-related function transcriptional attenuator common domain protein [Pseudarthrobacter siccitolerans]
MGSQRKHPGTQTPGSEPRSARRRHPLRTIFLVLLAVAVLVPVSAGAYLYNLGQIYESKTSTLESPFPAESLRPQPRTPGAAGGIPGAGPADGPAAGEPDPYADTSLNILVMGSDSRGATADEALSGANSNQRADTLMLVHIPVDRSKIYSISLMRDLWISIPDHGQAKINAALAFGGVPLMLQTVESLFQQRIDHVAMIDFEGFKGVTDAVGGVEVNVPQPFVSRHDHYAFIAGTQTLDGGHALEFVRERYAFADGDYQRVRNQQAFVRALFAKNLSPETLLNPVKVHNVLSAMAPFISVDSGLDAATLARLALELRDVRANDMVMFTLPTLGIDTSADGQSIVLPDPWAVERISEALAGDSLDTYVASGALAGGH